jgi:hypothetical protein
MDVIAIVISVATSVVSTILGSILLSLYKENKKLKQEKEKRQCDHDKAIKDGLQCILRKHLMDEHEIWATRGYITAHALENGLAMYRAYKKLGGNGMIDHMEEEIQELPIRD